MLFSGLPRPVEPAPVLGDLVVLAVMDSAAPRAPGPCGRSRYIRASASAACRRARRASPRPPAARTARCPRMKRLPDSACSVIAVIAAIAGARAGICMMPVPTWMRVVRAQDPGGRRDRVRAVGFRGPHRVVAEALRLQHHLHVDRELRATAAVYDPETHRRPFPMLFSRPSYSKKGRGIPRPFRNGCARRRCSGRYRE